MKKWVLIALAILALVSCVESTDVEIDNIKSAQLNESYTITEFQLPEHDLTCIALERSHRGMYGMDSAIAYSALGLHCWETME